MTRSDYLKKLLPKVISPLLAIAAATAPIPKAAAISGDELINFDGLQNNEQIANYYNGGFGSLGSGPGPNYGIIFNTASRAATGLEGGEPFNVINIPSPPNFGFSSSGQGMVMSFNSGLMGAFSFIYSSQSANGNVTVYEGLGATGNTLKSVLLPALQPSPPSNAPFQIWQPVNVAFTGTAKSIRFSGAPGQLLFDNITFQPIPEPLTILGAATAVGFGAFFKGHLSKKQPPDEE